MQTSDRGFTLIELLLVVGIMVVIATVAVPILLRARMTGNETSAIATLKVTSSSQVAYAASWGNGGYATTYETLGTPPTGTTQAFISEDLGRAAPVLKGGYVFALSGEAGGPVDGAGEATFRTWYGSGVPITPGTTGIRGFAVNTGNTVWQNSDGSGEAPPAPFVSGPTIAPVQ